MRCWKSSHLVQSKIPRWNLSAVWRSASLPVFHKRHIYSLIWKSWTKHSRPSNKSKHPKRLCKCRGVFVYPKPVNLLVKVLNSHRQWQSSQTDNNGVHHLGQNTVHNREINANNILKEELRKISSLEYIRNIGLWEPERKCLWRPCQTSWEV